MENSGNVLEKALLELDHGTADEDILLHLKTQVSIINSIASIYSCLYYVDMEAGTFMQIRAEDEMYSEAVGTSGIAQDTLDFLCANLFYYEYSSDMFDFVQLDTLDERLKGVNSISKEFVDIDGIWHEEIFIAGERDRRGRCKYVLWGFRTINEEKEKEEALIKKSSIDELTGCYNRRAYEDDIAEYQADGFGDNLYIVAVDVNGLKVVNDSLGHVAGDELIKGAADCMEQCLGAYGKVYRTGGDEFIAILFTNEEKMISVEDDLFDVVSGWSGSLVDSLTLSVGFASKKDIASGEIAEIEALADKRMYESKTEFYRKKGVGRNGQRDAHIALQNLYTKILKINLTTDSYEIINMVESEAVESKGFESTISGWLTHFATSGQVHPDDMEGYLQYMNVEYLKKFFKSGETNLSIMYRRKIEDRFVDVFLELIPANDYSDDNQSLFLYVKPMASLHQCV